MRSNDCGKIAMSCWKDLSNHIGYCIPDEIVVMPNHVHGIAFIDYGNIPPVGTRHAWSLRGDDKPQYRALPIIIGSYKSAVSKLIHKKSLPGFRWQKSYYDHIIRDDLSLNNIREYIRNNPKRWGMDPENKKIRHNPNLIMDEDFTPCQ
jgi:REP element-mobilizing transposase RayT